MERPLPAATGCGISPTDCPLERRRVTVGALDQLCPTAARWLGKKPRWEHRVARHLARPVCAAGRVETGCRRLFPQTLQLSSRRSPAAGISAKGASGNRLNPSAGPLRRGLERIVAGGGGDRFLGPSRSRAATGDAGSCSSGSARFSAAADSRSGAPFRAGLADRGLGAGAALVGGVECLRCGRSPGKSAGRCDRSLRPRQDPLRPATQAFRNRLSVADTPLNRPRSDAISTGSRLPNCWPVGAWPRRRTLKRLPPGWPGSPTPRWECRRR